MVGGRGARMARVVRFGAPAMGIAGARGRRAGILGMAARAVFGAGTLGALGMRLSYFPSFLSVCARRARWPSLPPLEAAALSFLAGMGWSPFTPSCERSAPGFEIAF